MKDNDRKMADRKMGIGNLARRGDSKVMAPWSAIPSSGNSCNTHTYEEVRNMTKTACAEPLPARVYGDGADVQRPRKIAKAFCP